MIWMPCNPGENPRPAPSILTDLEVIQFLRIDSPDPRRTLQHWRTKGQLTGIRIARRIVYRLEDVLTFVERQSDEPTLKPRKKCSG